MPITTIINICLGFYYDIPINKYIVTGWVSNLLVLQTKKTQIRYHKSAFIGVHLRFNIYKYFMIAPNTKLFYSLVTG